MTVEEFAQELRKLELWCRKLTDDQRMLLYQELQHISIGAFRQIVTELLNNIRPGSPFPSVRDFKDLWIEWLRSHPENVIKQQTRQYCPECGGKGYFEVVYKVVPTVYGHIEYSTLLPCAGCENWKTTWGRKPKRLWTLDEIEAHPQFRLKKPCCI